jgi:hypothetical protein
MQCFFAIGVRVCAEGPCPIADLDVAMEVARAIPLPVGSKVMEGLDGYLGATIELHLVAAGERISGALRFGAAEQAHSVMVADVRAPWWCWKTIDVSPEALAKRRESVRALGVEHGWAQYWFVER